MNLNLPVLIDMSIPLIGGAIATVVGFRRAIVESTPPKVARRTRVLRWLGPALIAFAMFQLSNNFHHEPTASDIAQALRQKTALPTQVDAVTTLESIGSNRNHVVFLMKVHNQSVNSGVTSNDITSAIRPSLRSKICSNKQYLEILKNDIELEYTYTVNNSSPSTVVISRVDCSV